MQEIDVKEDISAPARESRGDDCEVNASFFHGGTAEGNLELPGRISGVITYGGKEYEARITPDCSSVHEGEQQSSDRLSTLSGIMRGQDMNPVEFGDQCCFHAHELIRQFNKKTLSRI